MPRLLPASLLAALLIGATPSLAQMPGGPPPAVGVLPAKRMPITESSEFIGRVQAVSRVALVARVTAFLDQRLFTEGTEVKQGDLLYRLEQPPFEADVQVKQAAVAQANALLENDNITLARAQALLGTPAGQRSNVDNALAQQRAQAAQLLSAQASLTQSKINLSYTEIHAPIDGKISRTQVTEGNVVSPSTGTLATIVSQDPMYVLFPIPVRTALDLSARYPKASDVIVRVRLPNGQLSDQVGHLDYMDPSISANTDTLTARAVIANPIRPVGITGKRELIDGEFVTALVQGVTPVEVLAVPRAAILSDQQGDYVFVVGPGNKAEQRRVHLGQSTAEIAAVTSGLQEGEPVIVEGIQRVRPGVTVSPGPAAPGPGQPGGPGGPAPSGH